MDVRAAVDGLLNPLSAEGFITQLEFVRAGGRGGGLIRGELLNFKRHFRVWEEVGSVCAGCSR